LIWQRIKSRATKEKRRARVARPFFVFILHPKSPDFPCNSKWKAYFVGPIIITI
jgi:hypothetical protein